MLLSLILGSIAALAWGIHDFCVRFVAVRIGVMPGLFGVLLGGVLVLVPIGLMTGGWETMEEATALSSAACGLVYALAAYALYRAFEIGPIRLVAPIVGTFPVLSVIWAVVNGARPGLDQILAILAVLTGASLAAVLGDRSQENGRRGEALAWAIAACVGFALTFALGQYGSASGGMPAILLARVTSTAAIGLALVIFRPKRPDDDRGFPWFLLAVMATADAVALSLVLFSGTLPRPELAAVSSSVFGMVTILMAWAFLKEPMTRPQWLAVCLVFAGIGYLAS